jgi:hypothetical protein
VSESPQWYDSVWLGMFLAARRIVADVAPERLDAFVAAFAPLRTDPGFAVRRLPQLFGGARLDALREAVRAVDPRRLEMEEVRRFGRFVVHDLPVFTALQEELTEQVGAWAGEPVEPSYNFLSLYTRAGVCEPHLDAPSAKWTLDICLDQSAPWPIHFSQIVPWPERSDYAGADWQAQVKADRRLRFSPEVLMPGDAVLFSGSSQWHYRDPMPDATGRAFCDLLFLHFVPRGTLALAQPALWADHFGIPELAAIPGIGRMRHTTRA